MELCNVTTICYSFNLLLLGHFNDAQYEFEKTIINVKNSFLNNGGLSVMAVERTVVHPWDSNLRTQGLLTKWKVILTDAPLFLQKIEFGHKSILCLMLQEAAQELLNEWPDHVDRWDNPFHKVNEGVECTRPTSLKVVEETRGGLSDGNWLWTR